MKMQPSVSRSMSHEIRIDESIPTSVLGREVITLSQKLPGSPLTPDTTCKDGTCGSVSKAVAGHAHTTSASSAIGSVLDTGMQVPTYPLGDANHFSMCAGLNQAIINSPQDALGRMYLYFFYYFEKQLEMRLQQFTTRMDSLCRELQATRAQVSRLESICETQVNCHWPNRSGERHGENGGLQTSFLSSPQVNNDQAGNSSRLFGSMLGLYRQANLISPLGCNPCKQPPQQPTQCPVPFIPPITTSTLLESQTNCSSMGKHPNSLHPECSLNLPNKTVTADTIGGDGNFTATSLSALSTGSQSGMIPQLLWQHWLTNWITNSSEWTRLQAPYLQNNVCVNGAIDAANSSNTSNDVLLNQAAAGYGSPTTTTLSNTDERFTTGSSDAVTAVFTKAAPTWSATGQPTMTNPDSGPTTYITRNDGNRSSKPRTGRSLRTALGNNRCVWSNTHFGSSKIGAPARRSGPYNHYHHKTAIGIHNRPTTACLPHSSAANPLLWPVPEAIDANRNNRFSPASLSQGSEMKSNESPTLNLPVVGNDCQFNRYFASVEVKNKNSATHSDGFALGSNNNPSSKPTGNMIGNPTVILNPEEPREMFIGGVPSVSLPLWAYKKCLTMVRGEPHELGPRLCLRLLQSLFSLHYLVTHNYNGSGGKAPIDPVVMGAVLRQAQIQFGSGYFFTEPMALGKLRDYLNNAFRVMAFRQRKGERVRSPFWNDQGEPIHGLEAPVEFAETSDVVVLTEYGKSSWRVATEQLKTRNQMSRLNNSNDNIELTKTEIL